MSRIDDLPSYRLNLEKIEEAQKHKWFGSTDFSSGSDPKDIVIDESEPLHFVQLFYIIKEQSWFTNRWATFTVQDLSNWVKRDKDVYTGDTTFFGEKFFNEFPTQINFFIDKYCDVVM